MLTPYTDEIYGAVLKLIGLNIFLRSTIISLIFMTIASFFFIFFKVEQLVQLLIVVCRDFLQLCFVYSTSLSCLMSKSIFTLETLVHS